MKARNDTDAHLRAVRKALKLKAKGKRARVVFSVQSGWTVYVFKGDEE